MMRFFFRRRPRDPYAELRARMIAETEIWLTEALRRPELAVRIPTVRAGTARFPRSLTRAFWDSILGEQ